VPAVAPKVPARAGRSAAATTPAIMSRAWRPRHRIDLLVSCSNRYAAASRPPPAGGEATRQDRPRWRTESPVATRLAAIGGIVWLTIFYTATAIWPEHNPFLDEHVVYAVLLFALVLLGAGSYLGLGDRWNRTKLVRRLPFLK
jgi:peptidoglycan/LPS O-acetylase OafA/YrhL